MDEVLWWWVRAGRLAKAPGRLPAKAQVLDPGQLGPGMGEVMVCPVVVVSLTAVGQWFCGHHAKYQPC